MVNGLKDGNVSTSPSDAPTVSPMASGSGDFGASKRRLLIIVILCLGLGGLLASGGYLWYQHGHPKAPAAVVIKLAPPTAEQIHTVKYVTRGEGTITAFTDNSATLMLTDQPQPMTLQTTKTTHYMQGKRGYPSDRTALKTGHKTVLSYDKESKVATSVWVDYDAQ